MAVQLLCPTALIVIGLKNESEFYGYKNPKLRDTKGDSGFYYHESRQLACFFKYCYGYAKLVAKNICTNAIYQKM